MSLTPPAIPRNQWEASELVFGGGWLDKTGFMASLKPLDASGEFTFSRNSTKFIFGSGNSLYTVPVNRIPLRWVPGRNRFELFPERFNNNLFFPSNSLAGISSEGVTISGNVVTEQATNSNHRVFRSFSGINLSTLRVFSVDLLPLSGTREVMIQVSNLADGDIHSRRLNLQTGQLAGSIFRSGSWQTTGLRDGVIQNPDGSLTLFLVASSTVGSDCLVRVIFHNGTNESYLGSTGNAIRIEHLQIQTGTLPSSRILTTSGIASRSADVITNTAAINRIGQTQGVVRCEVNLRPFARDTNPGVIWQFDDGTLNNRICLQAAAGGNTTLNLIVVIGGVVRVNLDNVSSNERFLAVVVKYRAGEFKVWVNGVLVASSTFNGMPTGLSVVRLGGISPLSTGFELNDFIGAWRNTKLLFSDETCLALSNVA